MSAYGQVYWTNNNRGGLNYQWRGILMDDDHAEVWVGLNQDSPDEAYEKMTEAAPKFGITDLRRWSGDASKMPHNPYAKS